MPGFPITAGTGIRSLNFRDGFGPIGFRTDRFVSLDAENLM